jgi:VanZ family protein
MRSSFFGIRIAILLLAIYWVLLAVSTHLPGSMIQNVVDTTRWSDKVVHWAAFAGFAFLLAWAIPTHPAKRMRNVLWAALGAAAYAVTDEITQPLVGRTADGADLVADFFGILSGLIVYAVVREALQATSFRLEP